MKRSEINAALKEMEEMVKEYRFAVPPSAASHRRSGRRRDMITMKSVTTCWDGISRITAWGILKRQAFL